MTFPMIRQAREADLAAINRIYNREVREGFATWELDEWPDERRLEWFQARTPEEEPVLVATIGDDLVGFGYLTKYRGRRGYQYTRENTVMIDPAHQRQGLGRTILSELVERARWMGIRSVVAFIDAENLGSIVLHQQLGYQEVGHELETGRKFGTWRSSVELQLLLDRPDVE